MNYDLYVDEDHGYSIEYVSNWKVVKSDSDDDGTLFVDASSDPPSVVVNVNKIKSAQSLEVVSREAKKFTSKQPGVSRVNILSEHTITASGMQGIENITMYKLGGDEVFVKSAYLFNQGNIITISMAGSAQTIEAMHETFKYMIENIKLL